MRITTLLLLAGLALPSLLVVSSGRTQEEEDNPYLPKPAISPLTQEEQEAAKLEESMQGAWTLTRYINPKSIVTQENVRGFALIYDGFMTINFQALADPGGIVLGEQQYVVQSTAFLYRLLGTNTLQVSGISGFTNDNEDFVIEFQSSRLPREYSVILTTDRLQLTRGSGVGFEFRRTLRTEFPQAAIDRLQQQRGGYGIIDDSDPFGIGEDDDV